MILKEGGQYENPSAGTHVARCFSLIDMGTQVHSYNNEQWQSRDLRITWELPSELMEGLYKPEVKGKPFAVSMTVKQSLHSSSKLRGFLESWRGKKFTKEELQSYDAKKLLGAPCLLTILENGDYRNVDSIAPCGKLATCPPAINQTVFISLEPGEFNEVAFEALGEKLKEKIKASPEYFKLTSPESEPEQPDSPSTPKQEQDDVPF